MSRPVPATVVDTNLVLSALISQRGNPDRLIQLLYRERLRSVLSDELFAEYEDVLGRSDIVQRFGLTSTMVESLLRFLWNVSIRVGSVATYAVPIDVRDPKDRHVIATALVGDADYLVTGDKDLLVLAGEPALGSLQILTVAQLLSLVDSD